MLARRHWLLDSITNCACTVNNADAKCVDTGALGGRATCTANVTIRLLGPIVSLDVLPSSRPTKRRSGIFSWLYLTATIDGTKYLYLYCTSAMMFRV